MQRLWDLTLTAWKRLLTLRMVAWSPPIVVALVLWWSVRALVKWAAS
jgi:hypothetical protein